MKANMIVDIKYLPEFERRAKKMAKKYRSFIEDYDKFLPHFWIVQTANPGCLHYF